jgi:hypothetical protein
MAYTSQNTLFNLSSLTTRQHQHYHRNTARYSSGNTSTAIPRGTAVEIFLPRGIAVEIFLLLYRAVLLYLQNTATFYRRFFWSFSNTATSYRKFFWDFEILLLFTAQNF